MDRRSGLARYFRKIAVPKKCTQKVRMTAIPRKPSSDSLLPSSRIPFTPSILRSSMESAPDGWARSQGRDLMPDSSVHVVHITQDDTQHLLRYGSGLVVYNRL